MARERSQSNIESSRLFDDYENVQCIGEGGSGKVYKATNKCDERRCGIKRIELLPKSKDSALKEVRTLVNLWHENVVKYYSAWIECHSLAYNLDLDPRLLRMSNDEDSSSPQLQSSSGNKEDSTFDTLQFEINDMGINEGRKQNRKLCHWSEETTNDFIFIQPNMNDDDTYDKLSPEIFPASTTENKPIATESPNSINPLPRTVEDLAKKMEYLYIATELCHHHTLYHRLLPENRSKYIPDRLHGLKIFYQIVNGMAYIHQHDHKLIHRDLKPHNIFFSLSNNMVKIGDFGLAKKSKTTEDEYNLDEESHPPMIPQESSAMSHHHQTIQYSATHPQSGTPSYMSPEQLRNEQPTQKVDIYAMGLILLELLYPFADLKERRKILKDARSSELKLPDDFNSMNDNKPAYARLIRRLITHDKNSRSTSMELQQNKKHDIDQEDYQRLENITLPKSL